MQLSLSFYLYCKILTLDVVITQLERPEAGFCPEGDQPQPPLNLFHYCNLPMLTRAVWSIASKSDVL